MLSTIIAGKGEGGRKETGCVLTRRQGKGMAKQRDAER
jgi:hypothetical protein